MAVTGPIAKNALARLFTAPNCRAFRKYLPKEVPESVLKEIYDNLKWGPTAFNCNPIRIRYVRSAEAKEKLLSVLDPGNIPSVKSAPVTAILALDSEFTAQLPKLSLYDGPAKYFEAHPEVVPNTARLNQAIQVGYFITTARALGLDVGPMTGFYPDKLDEVFFQGTPLKSAVLVNLGYADPEEKLFDRSPRLEFDEACEIL
jgi:nitroreductase